MASITCCSIHCYNYYKNHPSYLLVGVLFLSFFSLSLSDPRISQAALSCGSIKAPAKADYIPSFVKEMENLSQLVAAHNWATHFANSTIPIYGLAQCFKDLSHTDCLLCYAASRTKLPRCLPSISARIYLDGCFLRYDNYSFYLEEIDPSKDTVNCSSRLGTVVDEAERLKLSKSVGKAIDNVSGIAVRDGGFAVGELEGIYALAQCWKTIGSNGCRNCLKKAAKEVRGCLPKREGRALNAGCYLRYSTEKFYNDSDETEGGNGSLKRGVIIATVLAATAVVMLSLSVSYAIFSKLSKMKRESSNLGQISTSFNRSNLNFKYETLEKATDYFNPSRKIGQGGAGSVYKGILPNGKVVAVKRLFFNTRQWVDEFFNEVNLISGIQHKNLVTLLGCSIEGPESLLVYEYVPNKSLDLFIFEADKTRILNWKQRFDIILGTAEGLAYLHGGSKIRIIHRDIKSSNILLDDNLNAKIADFGLARCFAADKTHLSTGIAGTLGYMAPEYLTQGQLTDKADVYSFGVLVLEIVCGRRNNVFREDSGSLLQKPCHYRISMAPSSDTAMQFHSQYLLGNIHVAVGSTTTRIMSLGHCLSQWDMGLTRLFDMVWRLYRSDRLTEAVDPCLGDNYPSTEASSVLQIGLLCTQASASLRPSMVEVVCMLSNSNLVVPVPNQPPFLNSAGMFESESSIRSYSTNSFVSNALKKIGLSYSSSSESSAGRSLNEPSKREEPVLHEKLTSTLLN